MDLKKSVGGDWCDFGASVGFVALGVLLVVVMVLSTSALERVLAIWKGTSCCTLGRALRKEPFEDSTSVGSITVFGGDRRVAACCGCGDVGGEKLLIFVGRYERLAMAAEFLMANGEYVGRAALLGDLRTRSDLLVSGDATASVVCAGVELDMAKRPTDFNKASLAASNLLSDG